MRRIVADVSEYAESRLILVAATIRALNPGCVEHLMSQQTRYANLLSRPQLLEVQAFHWLSNDIERTWRDMDGWGLAPPVRAVLSKVSVQVVQALGPGR